MVEALAERTTAVPEIEDMRGLKGVVTPFYRLNQWGKMVDILAVRDTEAICGFQPMSLKLEFRDIFLPQLEIILPP